jgi:molybdenum cofactor cytidylyltransferase
MGSWKPLLPFGSATMIQAVVAAALQACGRVILVTGHRGAELAALFARAERVLVVENPDWTLGMFSSIQCGVRRVAGARFFVTLGDMPWIGPGVYEALRAAPAADAVFPVHRGERGHPVLFHSRVIPAVLAADPREGRMRDVAARFAAATIPWGDDSILRDADAPGDLDGAAGLQTPAPPATIGPA